MLSVLSDQRLPSTPPLTPAALDVGSSQRCLCAQLPRQALAQLGICLAPVAGRPQMRRMLLQDSQEAGRPRLQCHVHESLGVNL